MEVPFSARFHLVRSGRHPDGTLVEGLRMSRTDAGERLPFSHRPVMTEEILAAFAEAPAGIVLDGTLGGAGHSRALLDAHPDFRIVGLDRDPDAIAAATAALAPYGDRAVVVRSRFDRLDDVLDSQNVATISGALFDLGVSSPQLDRGDRGFSYRQDAPLDMRMDPDSAVTAADVVNTWPAARLGRLLAANGEARFARRIVTAIIANRPLSTTLELAEVVRNAIPAAARRSGGHPARRTFQAIRIAVNDELEILPGALDAAISRLSPGGVIAVLAYHSGEDRIVKERFREAETGGCVCPPGLPCVCGAEPLVKLVPRGARRPTAAEIAANHRAESARLRVAVRLPASTREVADD